ncbi:MAG: methylglyoxal synthase [Lachnospiraceae bacterium]|nr:methylglyoxal synthase [Lachnospiraceae bacterium]
MNIGFIAHDTKKMLMQNLCIAYRDILSEHTLYATQTTGRLISEASGLSVHKCLAGPLGGEQQLCTLIENNDIDIVFYLRDPQEHSRLLPDAQSVLSLCDMHNIPIATNLATSELLIKALERGDLDWRELYH